MKKFKIFLLFVASFLLVTYFASAQNVRTNPNKANYFIKGNLSIEKGNDGKPLYKLSEINSKGITFKDPGQFIIGKETDKEDVLFQFSHVKTDYPDGIETKLDFWRYDESIHEWQPDVETRQGSAGMEETKSMVVMLVLDCSTSLGDDFKSVQEAAKNFTKNLLNASKGGNIKLGIVSFSKINETKFLDIRPLTSSSYSEVERFINGLSMQNGTALYYAMDKSIDIIEDYCAKSISESQPLSTAMMVTFTDGLDQTSRDAEHNIYTADDYYNELRPKVNNAKIGNIPIRSVIRGVQGDDIISSAQLGKFKSVGESLGDFKLLGSISELSYDFENIALSLINEWRVLNCFVPNSFKGQVAWTYPQKPPKPKIFVGINLGGGLLFAEERYEERYYSHSYGQNFLDAGPSRYNNALIPRFSLGLDVAFPIGKRLNLGLYMSGGYPDISFGPLALVNFSKMSLYIGTGFYMAYTYSQRKYDLNYLNVDIYGGMGQEFRLGIVSRKHFYAFISSSYIINYYDFGKGQGTSEVGYYQLENGRVVDDAYKSVKFRSILISTLSLHLGFYF